MTNQLVLKYCKVTKSYWQDCLKIFILISALPMRIHYFFLVFHCCSCLISVQCSCESTLVCFLFGRYPRHWLLPLYGQSLPFQWNEGTDESFVITPRVNWEYRKPAVLMGQICGLLLPEKSHDSKLLVVMEVFQDNYILSSYLLINRYFYAKMQENFFCCKFLQFWAFLLMFISILIRDHVEIWFYLKYAYLKEHISAFGKILSFGHHF